MRLSARYSDIRLSIACDLCSQLTEVVDFLLKRVTPTALLVSFIDNIREGTVTTVKLIHDN